MNAKLDIHVALRGQTTYLKSCFVTPPFKVADITEDRRSGQLQLMLMCSSPGILDDDVYETKLVLEAYCHVQLHTQSYQRLFQMKRGAKQTMEVQLKEGASFVYLPHPSVPHANAIFTSVNKIYMQPSGSLIWGEIITCGRQLKDEVFSFSKYHSITELNIADRLVIKENLLMQPSIADIQAMGQLEGFTHQATMLCVKEMDVEQRMNVVYDYLSAQEGIEFGISKAPCKGFVLRILGYKGEQLHALLKAVSEMIQTVHHAAYQSS